MVELRICVGDVKNAKTYQKVLNEKEADVLKGLKIGDKIKGDNIGMSGYELEITGGSNDSGFPMRKGIESSGMVKIYAQGGVGIRKGKKGMISRKSVAGAVVDIRTTQLNLKVLTYGKKAVAECFGIEEKKEVKEEKPKGKEKEEEKND